MSATRREHLVLHLANARMRLRTPPGPIDSSTPPSSSASAATSSPTTPPGATSTEIQDPAPRTQPTLRRPPPRAPLLYRLYHLGDSRQWEETTNAGSNRAAAPARAAGGGGGRGAAAAAMQSTTTERRPRVKLPTTGGIRTTEDDGRPSFLAPDGEMDRR
ncbi:hypothetical protein Scep_019449 [Stephania cephalantha]|uniref:Uncharacterized protein n=1 Tax=Stephania cephalantha TaxID=152367 RepID=A0AAP0IB73_9MAGN